MTNFSRREAFVLSFMLAAVPFISLTVQTVAAPSGADSDGTIIEKLKAAGNFNSLLADMAKTGVWTKLEKNQSFTLFAPTDYAYAYAKEGYHLTVGGLQKVEPLPTEGEALLKLMFRHLIPRKIDPAGIKADSEETTMDGMLLSYDVKGDVSILSAQRPNSVRRMHDMFMVNLGPARAADGSRPHNERAYDANLTSIIEASDGIIYVIDAVLLHPINSE